MKISNNAETLMKKLVLLCCLLASAVTVYAQSAGSATIQGAVTDSSGAAVTGAKVTVLNVATSFVSSVTTGAEGTYYVPYLMPGAYRVTIETAGFKRYVRDGVVVRISETQRLDVALELGNVTESVNVVGSAALLETETSTSGQILEGTTIIKIPVLEKSFSRLVLYMPGVNTINGQHVSGQRERALNLTLDGLGGKEPVRGSPNNTFRVMTASLDLVQEAKLSTTGLSAEFGHSSGGLLSAVFRSGTNQFHGSLEDRYTVPKFVHRSYFEILPTNYLYHEASGTASGPLYLPKVYDGRNRTFLLFGVQYHHGEIYENVISSVPSQDMLNGDFSFGGRGLPIYDPATTRQDASGRWVRDPFPANRVPTARYDTVSRNLLALNPWVPANAPGIITPNGPQQNLVIQRFGGYYFTRYDGKVDHQFNSHHKIFGRYSQINHNSPDRISPEVTDRAFDPQLGIRPDQYNAIISDTYTLSPTMINEFRIGFNRRRESFRPQTQDKDWAKRLGIPGVSPESFPQFEPRFFNLGPGGKGQDVGEDFSLQNNFTRASGRHTVKGGYELIRTRYNSLVRSLPSGSYNMGGTESPFTPNTGNNFASLLLGSVASATFTRTQAAWLPRWWSHSLFIQDDYKPARNLTFNLGLRWSYESPFKTKFGQQSQFDPTARDPLTGRVGAIVHNPGPLAASDRNNFQPRVGMAWNFRPKLVFRGSFGVHQSDLLTNGLSQNFEEYFATANVQPPPGDPRVAFQLSQGPPALQFRAAADGSVPFLGANFSARRASWYDPHMRMPYVMTWSGGFQWEFAPTWLVELQYQGSSGVGLLNNWNINVLPLNVSADPAQLERIRQQTQDFLPYPHFGEVQHFSNYGHNSYHGGTLRVEKRYSAGFVLSSFYTFSKTMNDADDDGTASGITFYNRRLEKGRANYDVNHRSVTTLTYELPLGKGKRFGNNGGWRNAIFGGWEVVGVQTLQTGPPFTVSFAGSPNRYLPGASRPIQVAANDEAKLKHVDIGPNRFPFSAQNRYLKLGAFRYPDNFQAGTVGRNTLQAPGLVWLQLSLSKSWKIKERLKAILRVDMNNPLNYQNFGNPDSSFNATNPANFGTFSGVRGSFSDVGTSRGHSIVVTRLEW
ncbi:MAG: TonB-dependent receptor [Bryobacterales bacterium]|nr:TonB-dependent receptor [Bryobacterales bacterium]